MAEESVEELVGPNFEKLVTREKFIALSYNEKMKEIDRMQKIYERLQELCDKKKREKSQELTKWNMLKSDIEESLAKQKNLSEKEALIDRIEDLDSKLKDTSKDDTSTVYSAVSEDNCGFPDGLITSQKKKVSNLKLLFRQGDIYFFTGTLAGIENDVLVKMAIDPSFFNDDASSNSEESGFSPLPPSAVYDDLRREISIISTLWHDNIIIYYDDIESNGLVGYVMEYCPKGNLHDYIVKNGPLPESRIKTVLLQILRALAYLAESYIVHCDIKTANILIVNEDVCKLCDFGSSVQLDRGSRNTIIDDGSYRGTDVFIAPECGRGMQRGRSDIWSLGCCLYEMLTGELPWKDIKNKSTTRESVIFSVAKLHKAPEVSEQIWNGVSPELHDFFNQCFDFDDTTRARAEDLLMHPLFKNMS